MESGCGCPTQGSGMCGAAKWIPAAFSETQVILKVEATRKEQHAVEVPKGRQ